RGEKPEGRRPRASRRQGRQAGAETVPARQAARRAAGGTAGAARVLVVRPVRQAEPAGRRKMPALRVRGEKIRTGGRIEGRRRKKRRRVLACQDAASG